MNKPANNEILINLLKTKESMEKTVEFPANVMQRAREKNPVSKLKVVQMLDGLKKVRETTGDARKAAASGLAKSLIVPAKSTSKPASKPAAKSVFCTQCGAQLTPGAAFCGNCGAKTA